MTKAYQTTSTTTIYDTRKKSDPVSLSPVRATKQGKKYSTTVSTDKKVVPNAPVTVSVGGVLTTPDANALLGSYEETHTQYEKRLIEKNIVALFRKSPIETPQGSFNVSSDTKVVISGELVEVYKYARPRILNSARRSKMISPYGTRTSIEEGSLDPSAYTRHHNSKHRARRNMRRKIWANYTSTDQLHKHLFLTFSYKENMQDYDRLVVDWENFMARFKRMYPHYEPRYVAVPERQKRGAWHIHVMMFNAPFIPIQELCRVWGHGGERNGVDLQVKNLLQKQNRLKGANYMAKYVGKTFDDAKIRSKGRKAYWVSKNLIVPTEYERTDSCRDVVWFLEKNNIEMLGDTRYVGHLRGMSHSIYILSEHDLWCLRRAQPGQASWDSYSKKRLQELRNKKDPERASPVSRSIQWFNEL